MHALRADLPVAISVPRDRFAWLDDESTLSDYVSPDGLEMELYLEGVRCAACVGKTERVTERVPGVQSLRLDLSRSIATVRRFSNGSFAAVARALDEMGYPPEPVKRTGENALQKRESRRELIRLGIAAAVAGNAMLMAVALYVGADQGFAALFRWASLVIALPGITYAAAPFYRGAWTALRRYEVSIDVPIALGLAIGSSVSVVNLFRGSPHLYFDSVTSLVFLLLSSRYLLRRIHEKAADQGARARFGVPAGELPKLGEIVHVERGARFPGDGVVTYGEGSVSLALLTGESIPVPVRIGVRVFAGAENLGPPLEVRIEAVGGNTRLGAIVSAMEAGMAKKAPIVEELDRVGRAFLIGVLGLVVVGFFVGLPLGAEEAFRRALAVALVVCPCTFAFATPLAMTLGTSRAAKNGILLKNAEILERMSRVDTVFFDKTGTLTTGQLEVLDWSSSEPGTEAILLALEAGSSHPVSHAIRRHFANVAKHPLPALESVREEVGFGVSGTFKGALYEAKRSESNALSGSSGMIASGVALYRDGVPIAQLSLGDRLRADSLGAVEELRDLGISMGLLSGDSEAPVRAVARALSISEAISKSSPEEKGRIAASAPRGLMVGDGANDAVALASAYAGFAVSGGVEMSFRAAGAYSAKPGITSVVELLRISRLVMRVIRRNLVFAVAYNLVAITVALAGHLNPLFAAVLMPASAATLFFSTLHGMRAGARGGSR